MGGPSPEHEHVLGRFNVLGGLSFASLRIGGPPIDTFAGQNLLHG